MNAKSAILLILKGMGMGAADVIPGVSGGTIAFITGIYEQLITSIKNINIANLRLLFTGQIKAFWKNIGGTFLTCVLAGIAVSFLSIAHVMTFLMENFPVQIWAFFFGLIIASSIFIAKSVKWNAANIVVFVIFTVASFFITSPENHPLNTSNDYWYIFVCGGLAICAMLLPGISGSFILLLLGQYTYVLTALTDLNIPVIATFIAGAVVGIIAFSHVLAWLLKKFKMITLAALTGFMTGSLNKIWPWKTTLDTYTNSHGKILPLIEKNILPQNIDNQFFMAILLIIIGFSLIFIIEFIAKKLKQQA